MPSPLLELAAHRSCHSNQGATVEPHLPRLLAVERICKRSYTAVEQQSRQDSHGASETGGDFIESCGEYSQRTAFQHPLSQSNHGTSETGDDYGAAAGDLGGKYTEAGYDATSYSSYSASRCEYLEPARRNVPRFTHVPIVWSKAYGGAHASMVGVQSVHNCGPKAWTHTGVADLDPVPSAFARTGPSANTHHGPLEQGTDERNRQDGHSQSRGSLSYSALAGPPRLEGHQVSGVGGVSQRDRARPIDRNPSHVTSKPISTAGSEIEKRASGLIDEAMSSLGYRRPLKFAGGFGGPFIRT